MSTEKGVIVAVYKKPSRENRFLVLNRKKNWEGWELPKGHLENNDYTETVKIELEEEAGIREDDIKSIEEMDMELEWNPDEKEKRNYRAFLVEVDKDVIADVSGNPDEEHEKGFFLSKEDCKGLLTYEEHEEVLEKASEKIS
ncbi:MAG: NUDIX domain-containing protein [Candidatus Nanohaloarchaea archaeon]